MPLLAGAKLRLLVLCPESSPEPLHVPADTVYVPTDTSVSLQTPWVRIRGITPAKDAKATSWFTPITFEYSIAQTWLTLFSCHHFASFKPSFDDFASRIQCEKCRCRASRLRHPGVPVMFLVVFSKEKQTGAAFAEHKELPATNKFAICLSLCRRRVRIPRMKLSARSQKAAPTVPHQMDPPHLKSEKVPFPERGPDHHLRKM